MSSPSLPQSADMADPNTNPRRPTHGCPSCRCRKGKLHQWRERPDAVQTIAALKADKRLAKFQFRTRNRWINGGENRSTIRDFYGAGAEDTSRTETFEFTNGEPPVLLGNNEGANPVEFLLHALAGCVTTTFVLHAMARGITIRELSTELEGDLDLQGYLASTTRCRPATSRSASA